MSSALIKLHKLAKQKYAQTMGGTRRNGNLKRFTVFQVGREE